MTNKSDNTLPPELESILARIGIFALAGLSAWMGYWFWDGRGDTIAAYLTLACEVLALGGFAVALHHIGRDNWRAAGAGLVTLLAAGWCGLTTFEKLQHDTHERAVAAAIELPAYRQAADQLSRVTEEYERTLRERAPADLGPRGLAAWSTAQRELLALLSEQVDTAQKRLDDVTPSASINLLALVRGFGLNIATLIGLAVFGGFHRRPEEEPAAIAPETAPAAEPTAEVIDLAAQRSAAAAALGRRSGEARRAQAEARKAK